MTLCFSIARTSQQQYVLAVGGLLGQLVEGERGALGSLDTVLGGTGEFKSADGKSLRHFEEPDVVGDGADHSYSSPVEFGLALGCLGAIVGEMFDNAGNRDGVSVEAGLVESLVDDLIELAVSTSLHEGVELGGERGTLMRPLR